MAYHSFEDLDVWEKACALTVKLYKTLKACTDMLQGLIKHQKNKLHKS